jgi:GSH-dependent disulfide-bond oxidoreductase
MIDLYTWSTPNGRKISIACEEMGLAYKVIPIDINKGAQFAPEFLAVSPNNKIPAIIDHETGVRLMESGAILMYLAEKTGKFWPQEGAQKWSVVQWLMWQMGGAGPILGQAHHFLHFNPGKSDYAAERFHTEAKRLYGVLDKQLGEAEYVAGGYSIADMALFPWIARFEWQKISLADHPNVKRWYQAVAARDAVKRGYDVPATGAAIPMP